MSQCPICDAPLDLPGDTLQGELKDCPDCGTELEVTGLGPITLREAPQSEEDWGE